MVIDLRRRVHAPGTGRRISFDLRSFALAYISRVGDGCLHWAMPDDEASCPDITSSYSAHGCNPMHGVTRNGLLILPDGKVRKLRD